MSDEEFSVVISPAAKSMDLNIGLRVSVVLATYNGDTYLEEQLRSLAAQTRPPAEIIIADDCSTDGTVALAEAFAASAAFPIRIARNMSQLGFRENFLNAAALATGDLIAFCDQDDVWLPHKLERCVDALSDPRIVLVVHQAELIDGEGHALGSFGQGIMESGVRPPLSYDPWHTFWGFSMVFRRSLLALSDPATRFIDYIEPSHRIAHDRWVMFLAQTVGHVAEIAEPLALYRQHGANLFGAGKGGEKMPLPVRSETYVTAARQMTEIVRNMPPEATRGFASYDRARSIVFSETAQRQAEFRLHVHRGRPGHRVLARIASGLVLGRYRRINGHGVRWRSIGRDLTFAIRGR